MQTEQKGRPTTPSKIFTSLHEKFFPDFFEQRVAIDLCVCLSLRSIDFVSESGTLLRLASFDSNLVSKGKCPGKENRQTEQKWEFPSV